ncbi:methyltransferase domain-containing protein [Pelotomaculum propionicicum]
MSTESYYENEKLWGRPELTLVQRQVLNYLSYYCDKLPPNARIADFGCGDGIILKELITRYPTLNGYGIDFSREALKHLSSDLHPCLADLASLPFDDGFFDLCFCIDVLEHVIPSELNRVVAEIHRVCRGLVLIVSPFLESDAVRTICPHCGCVFSPYYHLNRFSFDSWERAISGNLKDRSVQFVPLGATKPLIPPEIGPILVAAGGYVLHQHETVCPQCKVKFNRPEPGLVRELSTILGPYAAENRDLFNWIFEEMGVLTLPKTGRCEYLQVDPFEGILIASKLDSNLEKREMPALIVKSCYEIDFEEMNAILPGADLFRSPAYIVDYGKLKKCDAYPGILWRSDDIESNQGSTTLRLVFPPEPDRRKVTLELLFLPEVAGTLRAILYALPPKSSIQIGYIEAFPSEAPNNMLIKLEPDNNFVTPFGLLVDLVWEPQSYSPCSASGLILHKLIHRDQPMKSFSLQNIGINPWPVETNKGSSYEIHLFPDAVSSLKYGYQGRVFDLTGQLELGRENNKNIIPMPLWGGLYEKSNVDEAKSGLVFNSLAQFYTSAFHEVEQQVKKYAERMEKEKITSEEIRGKLEQKLVDLEQLKTKAEEQVNALLHELTDCKNKLKDADREKLQLNVLELERDYLIKHIHFLKKRNVIQRIFNCD